MSSSTINPSKKSRGRPPVDSEQVNTRFERPVLDGIDAFSAAQDDTPSRPEAIRRIVKAWLVAHRFMPAGITHPMKPSGVDDSE